MLHVLSTVRFIDSQGMARMCCDPRRSVRQTAIAYLYRGLLAHTLHHTLTAQDWEACFLEVLTNLYLSMF